MTQISSKTRTVYQSIVDYVFSGQVEPGAKLIERELSRIIGASRIPVREALTRLVARRILVKDEKNHSVRLRLYDADEVSDLLEYREAIEIASVRVACEKCRHNDLILLDLICDQMDSLVGPEVSQSWIDLDRRFHQTIVAASGNARFINDFVLLIAESHYVFYLHPARRLQSDLPADWVQSHLADVVKVHREVVEAIRQREVELAVKRLRMHLRTASERLSRDILKAQFY